jgi:hypothetical protein
VYGVSDLILDREKEEWPASLQIYSSWVQDLAISILHDMLRINVQFAAQRQEYDATIYF